MSTGLKIIDKVHSFHSDNTVPLDALDKFHKSEENGSVHDGSTQLPEEEKTYTDGLREGQALAVLKTENLRAQHIETAQALQRAVEQISTQLEASYGRVVTQILKAVLPTLARKCQITELQDFIAKLAAPALCGEVILHANEHMQDLIEVVLQEMAKNSPTTTTNFKLEINQEQAEGRIHAHWQGGGGTFDIDGAVKDALRLLEKIISNINGVDNG